MYLKRELSDEPLIKALYCCPIKVFGRGLLHLCGCDHFNNFLGGQLWTWFLQLVPSYAGAQCCRPIREFRLCPSMLRTVWLFSCGQEHVICDPLADCRARCGKGHSANYGSWRKGGF